MTVHQQALVERVCYVQASVFLPNQKCVGASAPPSHRVASNSERQKEWDVHFRSCTMSSYYMAYAIALSKLVVQGQRTRRGRCAEHVSVRLGIPLPLQTGRPIPL